jgi:hypothetical protein
MLSFRSFFRFHHRIPEAGGLSSYSLDLTLKMFKDIMTWRRTACALRNPRWAGEEGIQWNLVSDNSRLFRKVLVRDKQNLTPSDTIRHLQQADA